MKSYRLIDSGSTPPANSPPTDITLSNSSVDEGVAGATIGTLSAVDPDAGETFTFAVIGSAATQFEIVGTTLKLVDSYAADYNSAQSINCPIRVTDSVGNTLDKTLVVTVVANTGYRLGLNMGRSGFSGWARWLRDMAPLQTFYVANGASGVISKTTGLPVSGDCKLTVYGNEGNVYPTSGQFQISWTGSGGFVGQSNPFTFAVPTSNITFNTTGEIASWTLTVVGESGSDEFTQTTLDRIASAESIRMLAHCWVNPDGTEYDGAFQYTRVKPVVGANTFYHPVRPEILARLAKEKNCDLWIPFHHLATDSNVVDFVTKIASVGFTGVLYVEHSNEVWSGAALSAPQHAYALAQADALGYGTPGAFDSNRRMAYHFDRSDRVAELAKAIYPNTVGVAGTSRATPNYINPDYANENLAISMSKTGLGNIDAFAIANYFGQSYTNLTPAATLAATAYATMATQVINDFNTYQEPLIQQTKDYCDTLGMRCIGYEGGLSMEKTGASTAEQEYIDDFAQSTEAVQCYEHAADRWKTIVGDVWNMYDDCGDTGHFYSMTKGELGPIVPRRQWFLDKAM